VRISRIKAPAAEINRVSAPDRASAMAKAIKEFAIPKAQQPRVVASHKKSAGSLRRAAPLFQFPARAVVAL
jgi:hypothetical protein